MKTKLQFTILFAIFCVSINAQTPNWQWSKSAGGSSWDMGNGISTDTSGNVFVIGSFLSSEITIGTTTLANVGVNNADIYVVKYDAAGNVLWANSAGGTADEFGEAVSTDAGGNVVVTGFFNSPSITFGSTTLTNPGLFVVKYDASGNVLWAKSAGGAGLGRGIATDASGNVLVIGCFYSPSITFGTTTLTNVGVSGADIFVVKYDASGNAIWAKSAGGTSNDWGRKHISTDAGGNVLVTGSFYSPSITFGTTTLTNARADTTDIFVVKYDASGNVLWAQSAGGYESDGANGISTDASGNVYVTGYFQDSTITFGTITLTNVVNYGYRDIFVVKYDASGNVLWAKSAGGYGVDAGNGISTDAKGNVLVTGSFDSAPITFGTTTLTNAGLDDIFVAKYDTSGNLLWAKSAGGTSSDVGSGISADANGNVLVIGNFESSSITFGTTTLTNASFSYHDIFVAKLDSTGAVGITETNNFLNTTNIFPNPFSTQTTLKTDNLLKNATLTVYNLYGQTVKEIKNILRQTVIISRDNLASGLYFVRLTENNKTLAVDKLVITD